MGILWGFITEWASGAQRLYICQHQELADVICEGKPLLMQVYKQPTI